MPKTASTTERVAGKLTAITTAAEALFKHTTKAISLRDKANRTTLTAMPAATSALPKHAPKAVATHDQANRTTHPPCAPTAHRLTASPVGSSPLMPQCPTGCWGVESVQIPKFLNPGRMFERGKNLNS